MSHPFLIHSRCCLCGEIYSVETVPYTCLRCGPAGTLDIVYDYERLKLAITTEDISARRNPTMWRYRPLLPVLERSAIPPLPVGWTPLVDAPRLAETLGLQRLWLKDDGRNPTGSLKDRASAMVVARANHIGAPVVTTASTGNAAAALAGVCASVGRPAVIFVPSTAPPAKIAQLLVYGAFVLLVQGSYDDAFDLSVKASEEYGWYCRNTGMNPFTTEGKKTAALEICEQLGWTAPDVVVVSVGDGNIIAGQYKGWYDLHQLGWIDRLPRLIGVQAEGSSALAQAWRDGLSYQQAADMPPAPAQTIADSISASLPRDRVKALRAVRETNGAYVTVTDSEILTAIPELARQSGVFAEPAASATLAGLRQAIGEGHIQPGERVVLLVTGNGLKDIRSAMSSIEGRSAGLPVQVDMDDVRRVIETAVLPRL